MTPNDAEKKAAELPCVHYHLGTTSVCSQSGKSHHQDCPAYYREQFVTALLDAAKEARDGARTILINVAAYGTKIDPCWCSHRNYRDDDDHDEWCVAARALITTPPVEQSPWKPMESAPKDGSYILLAGNSGYIGTPLRVEVCRYDAEYRPLQPWVDYAGDSFTESGDGPLYWMPLPAAPPAAQDGEQQYE